MLIKKYIRFHLSYFDRLYNRILLRTDKEIFALLFNIRSVFLRRSSRLQWNNGVFLVLDTAVPQLQYRFRHQRQGNMAYELGFRYRAEKLAQDYFLRHIDFKDGDVLLDCGANVGDLKIWFLLNDIKINYVAFEPSPIEFACLQENVHPSAAYNLGLWSNSGDLKFYRSSQGADSSLIQPLLFDDVVTIRAARLEEFVDGKVKCLKLEAEGAEPEVLEGLGDKLRDVEFITADLGFERGIDAESTLVQSTNFLLNSGFELVSVSHNRICALYRNINYTEPEQKI